MKTMNRKCGIAVLMLAAAMSFGKQGFGQTNSFSQAFSSEKLAISKPVAALQKKMKAEKAPARLRLAAFRSTEVRETAMSSANSSDAGPAFAPNYGGARTHFDALKGYYAQGRVPTKKEVTGWFSGRCFSVDTPNVPEGNMLVGGTYQAANVPDSGPLFPPRPAPFRVAVIRGEFSDSADLFDHMTPSHINDIMALLSSDEHVSAAVIRERSLTSSYKDGNAVYHVRRYGSYFIVSTVGLADDAGTGVKAGKAGSMCYFFKKVHD